MKIQGFNLKNILLGFLFTILVFLACEKEEEFGITRLFRPVTNQDDIISGGNWILISWQSIKGAVSYTVEISRDTFKTIDVSVDVDTNYVLFDDLEWYTLYQIQLKANASDSKYDSKMAYAGEKRTAKFPTILITPSEDFVTDVAAIVKWISSGEDPTTIKVYKTEDNSLAKEVELTTDDIAAEERIVSGLSPSTQYTIYIYSGEIVRGWELYETKVPFLTGDNGIDLRSFEDDPMILWDTLNKVPDGSVVILKRGMTYSIPSGYSIGNSVTVLSGYDFISELATIDIGSSFDIMSNSTIDSIVFKDLNLKGVYATGYVFNISTDCTIGKLKFESCRGQIFRGFTRLKDPTAASINTFSINDCIIDSLAGYGLVNVDNAADMIENIIVTNSTVYNAQKVFVSKANTNSVIIKDCTFNELPFGGNYFIDWRDGGGVLQPIKLTDCIIGMSKDNAGNNDARGYRGEVGTTIDVSGTYVTTDFISTNPSYIIPNLIQYEGTSLDLWMNPDSEVGDFNIKDSNFDGKRNSGDPRWRIE